MAAFAVKPHAARCLRCALLRLAADRDTDQRGQAGVRLSVGPLAERHARRPLATGGPPDPLDRVAGVVRGDRLRGHPPAERRALAQPPADVQDEALDAATVAQLGDAALQADVSDLVLR